MVRGLRNGDGVEAELSWEETLRWDGRGLTCCRNSEWMRSKVVDENRTVSNLLFQSSIGEKPHSQRRLWGRVGDSVSTEQREE